MLPEKLRRCSSTPSVHARACTPSPVCIARRWQLARHRQSVLRSRTLRRQSMYPRCTGRLRQLAAVPVQSPLPSTAYHGSRAASLCSTWQCVLCVSVCLSRPSTNTSLLLCSASREPADTIHDGGGQL